MARMTILRLSDRHNTMKKLIPLFTIFALTGCPEPETAKETKAEEKTDAKSDEKTDEKAEEKTEEKTDAKAEEKSDAKVEEAAK